MNNLMTTLRTTALILALGALVMMAACTDNDAATSANTASPSQVTSAPKGQPEASGPVGKTDAHGGADDDRHGVGSSPHADEGHGGGGARIVLSEADIQAAGIRIAPANLQAVGDRIAVPATVQADEGRLAHVAPKVSGRILKAEARLGDAVRQGQTLATLDSIEVGEAQAAYIEARTHLDLAVSSHERARALFDEQIIPQKDWLQAQADLEKARVAERAAAGRLRLLGVAQPGAQGEISSVYSVRAPFSGTVIEVRNAVQGELAKPEESLFTVADLTHVWVQASLPESDLGRIHVGSPAEIEVAAYPGERFAGRVTYLSNTLDKETRTVHARIEVANHKGRLRMQMFATAHIDAGAGGAEAVVIPNDAVVLMDGKPSVFVEEEQGFEPRSVEVGQSMTRGTVIRSGVDPGERVVVAGAYALKARALKSKMGEGHAH